ncbi:MAG: methyltransferase domain-containing protein [Alphaproteobacteria bacterium]|nr:methyltransferase domain-containing protein [Alphaproteobacteria bacterium]MCB9929356.1 methyltransferase domain-containing protein [Alphaproteobacteria bacterium]
MAHDYRMTFRSDKSASNYESKVYMKGSAADIWWEIERQQITDFVESHFGRNNSGSYLDFACGTGRLCSFLETYFAKVDALDISEEMIDIAKEKCQKTNFICGDITTSGPNQLNLSSYDLVTAFRFLANSQESLRITALHKLREVMRDRNSVLIINNHGNPYSHRMLFLPYHYLKDKLNGKDLYGYLTNSTVRKYLDDAGFEIITIKGSGFIPTKMRSIFPAGLCRSVEKALVSMRIFDRLGVNQMFFCRIK